MYVYGIEISMLRLNIKGITHENRLFSVKNVSFWLYLSVFSNVNLWYLDV